MAYFLEKHRLGGDPPFNISLLNLLQAVRKLNDFQFNVENGDHFHSTVRGNAHLPRFLDDIFRIWEGTESDLMSFIDELNEIHSSIRFTTEHFEDKINYFGHYGSLI